MIVEHIATHFCSFSTVFENPENGAARASRRVICIISRAGATRWRQRVGAVVLYYPTPSERNKPHATSATVPGETAMVERLLGALRAGPAAPASTSVQR